MNLSCYFLRFYQLRNHFFVLDTRVLEQGFYLDNIYKVEDLFEDVIVEDRPNFKKFSSWFLWLLKEWQYSICMDNYYITNLSYIWCYVNVFNCVTFYKWIHLFHPFFLFHKCDANEFLCVLIVTYNSPSLLADVGILLRNFRIWITFVTFKIDPSRVNEQRPKM